MVGGVVHRTEKSHKFTVMDDVYYKHSSGNAITDYPSEWLRRSDSKTDATVDLNLVWTESFSDLNKFTGSHSCQTKLSDYCNWSSVMLSIAVLSRPTLLTNSLWLNEIAWTTLFKWRCVAGDWFLICRDFMANVRHFDTFRVSCSLLFRSCYGRICIATNYFLLNFGIVP